MGSAHNCNAGLNPAHGCIKNPHIFLTYGPFSDKVKTYENEAILYYALFLVS
jgi:hypothetical protein